MYGCVVPHSRRPPPPMVDPVEAQKNLLAAWEGAGLTRFALPPPLLDRHADSPTPSESTTPPPPDAPAPEPSSESDDDGYYNHPHRDRVHDELMGIRRGKKKAKSKHAEGGAAAAAASQSAAPPPNPKPKPAAPPPKPRGRRPKAPVDVQCQNDVRAVALVDGLTMLGRSDVETKRKVLPSGKPTPIVVGKWGYVETEDLAQKMRRTQEYASRAARPMIICESVKQYRAAAR